MQSANISVLLDSMGCLTDVGKQGNKCTNKTICVLNGPSHPPTFQM